MMSPLTAGLIVKRTLPDWPVVDVGAPWHFWIEPAMPPQIWRSATLDVWKSRALQRGTHVSISCNTVSRGWEWQSHGRCICYRAVEGRWERETYFLLVHFTLETVSWRTSSGAANAQTKSIAKA